MTNERMKLLNCTLGLVAGVSLPVSALAVPQPAQEQTEKQPNIILIVADDLGYGDLSCYGAHRIQTPGMDRIANEGVYAGILYCGHIYPQPLFGDDREISLEQCGC